jgi:hypothetical protein
LEEIKALRSIAQFLPFLLLTLGGIDVYISIRHRHCALVLYPSAGERPGTPSLSAWSIRLGINQHPVSVKQHKRIGKIPPKCSQPCEQLLACNAALIIKSLQKARRHAMHLRDSF